ncbi:MAG: 1-deoxy-D-xylulose-5-phosphate reductoisomerase [Moraxella sp.]|nr:1-deoxy-D-xylulose-5-phosphate reductoisomerase [Moraxella sp.]
MTIAPTRLAIFGATGSIGESTLKLVRQHPNHYQIYALTAHRQLDKLLALCAEFCPKVVGVMQLSDDERDIFEQRLHALGIECELVVGQAGFTHIARCEHVDTVVAAIVGAAGLPSTLAAVQAGKKVLLANKEALVMAGELVIKTAQQTGAVILPIDSEHNAIFQCLPKDVQKDRTQIHTPTVGIKKLWLTASGGAFLNKSYEQMQRASIKDAVTHPNWSMGQKISVDSSTMMNKGLELIEACHLFDLPESQIDIVIHPQSMIHSMVEYVDGSFLAQLGTPDMCTPIAHALAYPERIASDVQSLDVLSLSALTFSAPDTSKFACLALARQAARLGNGATIILNAANEVAVAAFLSEEIYLTDIAKVVEKTLYHQDFSNILSKSFDVLDDIMALDNKARAVATDVVQSLGGGR